MQILTSRIRPVRRSICLLAVYVGLLPIHEGFADDWRTSLVLTGAVTVTDNANLAQAGSEESDAIFQVSPGIRLSRHGGRASLDLAYTPQLFVYGSNSDLNQIQNSLDARAFIEAVDDRFFIDGAAQIQQNFLTPFGPTPVFEGSATDNRVESRRLTVNPYLQGKLAGGTYLLRNDNVWTGSDNSGVSDVFTNALLAKFDGPTQARIQLGGEYNYKYTKFSSNDQFREQLARARATYGLTYDLRVFATGGYEKNNYTISGNSGPIYGGGFDWTPTPRTSISVSAEKRYFGSSYQAALTHRTRMTYWHLRGSRDISTYADLISLPAGSLTAYLDPLFATRFPDSFDRSTAINQYLLQYGLPSQLSSPLAFYTNRIFLQDRVEAGTAITGARHTLSFLVFWRKSRPLTSTGQPASTDPFFLSDEVVQKGGAVTFGMKLSELSGLALTYDKSKSSGTPSGLQTTQSTLRLNYDRRLGPKTYGSLGLRYVVFDSNLASNYREKAVTASMAHNF